MARALNVDIPHMHRWRHGDILPGSISRIKIDALFYSIYPDGKVGGAARTLARRYRRAIKATPSTASHPPQDSTDHQPQDSGDQQPSDFADQNALDSDADASHQS
jgi:hypothetical protein